MLRCSAPLWIERKPAVSLAPLPMPARRRAIAAAACALALSLSGCISSGFEAQTNASYDPGVGSNEAFGDVAVLAVLVVSEEEGEGTLSATLTRRIEDPVQLTGVTAVATDDEEPVEVTFGEPIEVPPNNAADPLVLGEQGEVRFSGPAVVAGYFVDVTFEFSDGKTVTLSAPVVDPGGSGIYDGVGSEPTQ
jgi:hypothetical protein